MACFLVTGGAGFMGSHLVDALLEQGHLVRVLDDLSSGKRQNLPRQIEFLRGDVTDPRTVAGALEGVDACFHLVEDAARLGAGRPALGIGLPRWSRSHRPSSDRNRTACPPRQLSAPAQGYPRIDPRSATRTFAQTRRIFPPRRALLRGSLSRNVRARAAIRLGCLGK